MSVTAHATLAHGHARNDHTTHHSSVCRRGVGRVASPFVEEHFRFFAAVGSLYYISSDKKARSPAADMRSEARRRRAHTRRGGGWRSWRYCHGRARREAPYAPPDARMPAERRGRATWQASLDDVAETAAGHGGRGGGVRTVGPTDRRGGLKTRVVGTSPAGGNVRALRVLKNTLTHGDGLHTAPRRQRGQT